LAESLKWNKSRLSHHLTRMQQRQLIERRDVDSRAVLVVLTAQGRGKLDAARPIHAASVRKNLISRLSHDRSESLLTISELLSGEKPARDHL
jgi:DNA-binding MarR family transcriptional regulator